jgi:flagellar motility protein MotE (MotC chaperone)
MSIPRPYQQINSQIPRATVGKKRHTHKSGIYKKSIFSLGLLLALYVFAMKCFLFSSNVSDAQILVRKDSFLKNFPIGLSVGSSVIASDSTAVKKTSESNKKEEEDDDEEEEESEKDLLALNSKNQIQTLYHLTARRKELEAREKKLQLKEQKLILIQQEIGSKIKQLSQVQIDIKKSLDQIDDQEKKRILKLVKIYENMNPKDAARIFNKLDNALLQQLLELMSQKKIALVLSGMDSQRVKDVTSTFANQKNSFSDKKPSS